jgi:hypothetical protein
MESRVEKYNDEETVTPSRTKKNASLYEDIGSNEITSFDINSNATVLETNKQTIDVEKLRDMLDLKYRQEPTNKSMGKYEEESPAKIDLDETREYDINTILDKAKENKENDYEVERLKKLRNTQVDILNNLNINKDDSEEPKAVPNEESQKLMDLINTINVTEATQKIKQVNPLDLLTDLKGNDDETIVQGAQKKETNITDSVNSDNNKTVDKSFYTTSNMFTQSDFDDFNDLKEEVTSTKVIIKVLIIVVIIAFICGVVFILNRILGWGLF